MSKGRRRLWHLIALGVAAVIYQQARIRADAPATPADLARLAKRRALEWGRRDETGFARMKPPVPGEWLFRFPENGQTYDEYVASCTNKRAPGRETIYFRPLGPLGARSRAAIASVVSFTRAFFQLETKLLPEEPISPEALVRDRRGNPVQYDTAPITARLERERPEDALVYAALADEDLFSGDLNFVFGVGTFDRRVGVYSFVRFGAGAERDERLYRRRAFQLVAHELGHILGLHHCIFYECEQAGALSLYESDRSSLHACPVCLAKLEWNVGFDAKKRYADLARVFRDEGLDADARFCDERAR